MASAPFARSSWRSKAAADGARFRGARATENLLGVRLRAGNEGEVAFFEDLAVMQLVAGNDPCKCAHRHFILFRHPTPQPSLAIETAKQPTGRVAHVAELGGEIGKAAAAKPAIADVIVLLETFDGCLVVAREAHCAVGEVALAVADMAEDFLHGPFVGSVAKFSVALAPGGEENGRLPQAALQRKKDIAPRHERNVLLVVGRVFAGFGSCELGFCCGHGG